MLLVRICTILFIVAIAPLSVLEMVWCTFPDGVEKVLKNDGPDERRYEITIFPDRLTGLVVCNRLLRLGANGKGDQDQENDGHYPQPANHGKGREGTESFNEPYRSNPGLGILSTLDQSVP